MGILTLSEEWMGDGKGVEKGKVKEAGGEEGVGTGIGMLNEKK